MGCVSCKRARRSRISRGQRKGKEASHSSNTLKSDSFDQNLPSFLENQTPPILIEEVAEEDDDEDPDKAKESGEKPDFEAELLQATDWSANSADRKPTQKPESPFPTGPETMNSWEVMVGLAEVEAAEGEHSPLHSFCFRPLPPQPGSVPGLETTKMGSPKSVWSQPNEPDSIASDFDPEIISNFRKALDQLSPPNGGTHRRLRSLDPSRTSSPSLLRLRSLEPDRTASYPPEPGSSRLGRSETVQERIRSFQERIDQGRQKSSRISALPHGEGRVVVYFTSLRGVRKTYEDCKNVRVIFKGYNVRVDEKDISMDLGFREELFEVLGGGIESFGGLPRVFVKEGYVGGVEEVKHMHETGELEKLLEGCERLEEEDELGCEGCGNVRFVPCSRCGGSCKLFDDEEDMFVQCPDCNENGIVRCPVCCV